MYMPSQDTALLAALALTTFIGNAAAGPLIQTAQFYPRNATNATHITTPTQSGISNLVPIHPSRSGSQLNVALTNSQTWQWGYTANSPPMANVTGHTKSHNERYLSLEHFDGAVHSAKCSDSGIHIRFEDKDAYHEAMSSWEWVNHSEERKIYFVLNEPGCGPDDLDRHPYIASNVMFGDDLSVQISAAESKWTEILGNYDIRYTTMPVKPSQSSGIGPNFSNSTRHNLSNSTHQNSRREFGDIATFNANPSLAHDLTHNIIPATDIGGGVTLELDCDPCSTSGELAIEIIANPFDTRATITQTQQIGADINLKLSAKGALTDALSKSFPILDISLDPIPAVGGILQIGPAIIFQANVDITEIEAEVDVIVGGTVSIDPNSNAQIKFPNVGASTFTGWAPSFQANTPSIDGSVSVQGDISPQVSLELDFTILGNGLAAGIALIAPDLHVEASVAASTAGDGSVCGIQGATVGASLEVGVQGELDLFGGVKSGAFDQNNLPNKKQLFSTSTQLFSTCLTVAGSQSTDAPATTTGSDSSATTTASAAPLSTPQITITTFDNTCCNGAGDAVSGADVTCDPSQNSTNSVPFNEGQCTPVGAPNGSGNLNSGSMLFQGFDTPDQNTCVTRYYSDSGCTTFAGISLGGAQVNLDQVCVQGPDFSDEGSDTQFFITRCFSGNQLPDVSQLGFPVSN
ncbi:hypothetical protein NA57DRAFT_62065 [Rhizodiscina lignyota]|uniref:Uncharacterized protein n=1 Tax=Rhizodiscina lignyota TaxID=1504668 RepID=A0A9P4M4L9_9PEZI|nr:hypothetical protein NA57DRAFT_62065 [Rhizodiscina lignyota]